MQTPSSAQRGRLIAYAATGLIVVAALLAGISYGAYEGRPSGSSASTSSPPAATVTDTATSTLTLTGRVSTVTSTASQTVTSTVTSTSTATVTSTTTSTVTNTASAAPAIITLAKSGLVFYDPLNTGDTSRWIFYGSAPVEGGSYSDHENLSGLYLGVQSHTAGQYEGLYGRISLTAEVFNAVLTLPSNRTSGGTEFDTGLYVQTGGTGLNYVACAAGESPTGYFWTVERAQGNATVVSKLTQFWYQSGQGQPLTRDCTIVTNGQNLLQFYLDGTLIYSSSSLDLAYQGPLSARLEVQTTDSSRMRYSDYSDFYATSSDNVTVDGVPSGATVQILGLSGQSYAGAVAGPSGAVVLGLVGQKMPLVGYILVTEQGKTVGTSATEEIWGGDVYLVSP